MGNIKFTKTVGSGNDFIVIDNRAGKLKSLVSDFSDFAKRVCERKLSIGADGVLILDESRKSNFKMRIFNPDGSEVTMCGNGARCAALYASQNGWCKGDVKIETGAGIISAGINGNNVKLKMTDPIHVTLNKDLGIGKSLFKAHFINTGVPHVVHFLDNVDDYPVREMGAKIRYHKAFEPDGTNANFVKVMGTNRIKVRTYERGVEDETLACGTGAVASAVVSYLVNGIQPPIEVLTKSGDMLRIYFQAKNEKVSTIYLEGPAKIIYEGGIEYV